MPHKRCVVETREWLNQSVYSNDCAQASQNSDLTLANVEVLALICLLACPRVLFSCLVGWFSDFSWIVFGSAVQSTCLIFSSCLASSDALIAVAIFGGAGTGVEVPAIGACLRDRSTAGAGAENVSVLPAALYKAFTCIASYPARHRLRDYKGHNLF